MDLNGSGLDFRWIWVGSGMDLGWIGMDLDGSFGMDLNGSEQI